MPGTHFLITIDPDAPTDFQKLRLEHALENHQPSLAHLIADALGNEPGKYLVSVEVRVEVKETRSIDRIAPGLPAIQESWIASNLIEAEPGSIEAIAQQTVNLIQ